MPLTQKQSYYLSIIENARTQGKSIRAAALDHDLNPVNLYAAVNQLRKIGALDKSTSKAKSGFVALNIEPVRGDKIELKTHLPNGQPLWLSCEAHQLPTLLRALTL